MAASPSQSQSSTLAERSYRSDLIPHTSKTSPQPDSERNTLPVDLRLVDYVSSFDRNLVCPICHCPFIQPVRLDCDHTFCRDCLSRAFITQQSGLKRCPSCRGSSSFSQTQTVPRFIIHMIEELIVKCPRHEDGCSSQLRRSDLQDHVDLYCEFSAIDCPSPGCKQQVPRKFQNGRCLHEYVTCESCGEELMELDLEKHNKSLCTKQISACPDCGKSFSKIAFGDHIRRCPQGKVNCLGASLGCRQSGERVILAEHQDNCALAALVPTMKAMMSRVDQQGACLDLLQRKNDILEGSVSNMQGLLANAALPLADTSGKVIPSDTSEPPLFDSATHHLLSLHESLREELDRVVSSISEVEARASMMILNENLRLKEEMAHTNAIVGSMRMQLQWLTSAQLQTQPRYSSNTSNISNTTASSTPRPGPSSPIQNVQHAVRRLSDSERTKL